MQEQNKTKQNKRVREKERKRGVVLVSPERVVLYGLPDIQKGILHLTGFYFEWHQLCKAKFSVYLFINLSCDASLFIYKMVVKVSHSLLLGIKKCEIVFPSFLSHIHDKIRDLFQNFTVS
jgi:hypothetical protein